jgi:septal ring-binding cell division protein DamX
MKSFKNYIFLCSVISISGCSWFGGGSCDPSRDPACNAPKATSAYSQQARWYCAGNFESRAWSCSHEPPYAEILKVPTTKLIAKNEFNASNAQQPKQQNVAWSSVVAAADKPSQPVAVRPHKSSSRANEITVAEQPVASTTAAKTNVVTSQPAQPTSTIKTEPKFGSPNLVATEPEAKAAVTVTRQQANAGETAISSTSKTDNEAQWTSTGDLAYDRFMDLPSGDFAIQLLASKTVKAIKAFADRVDLSNPTILKIEVYASSLFVLILDTFSSYQQAQETKAAWTTKHGDDVDPWIRTVGSLQESMQPIGPSD